MTRLAIHMSQCRCLYLSQDFQVCLHDRLQEYVSLLFKLCISQLKSLNLIVSKRNLINPLKVNTYYLSFSDILTLNFCFRTARCTANSETSALIKFKSNANLMQTYIINSSKSKTDLMLLLLCKNMHKVTKLVTSQIYGWNLIA